MTWHLLLAHFAADYPLQPGWIVRNKHRDGVLLLHAATHFLAMMVVTFPASARWWPYLLLLSAVHFGIDKTKNWFTAHRPQWNAETYLADQACHYLSIILVSAWMQPGGPAGLPALPGAAAVIATGLLVVTHVYMVTERILSSRDPSAGPVSGDAQSWARLAWRAAMYALFLAGWQISAPAAILASALPYTPGRAGLRFLLRDVLVALSTALLVILVNAGVFS